MGEPCKHADYGEEPRGACSGAHDFHVARGWGQQEGDLGRGAGENETCRLKLVTACRRGLFLQLPCSVSATVVLAARVVLLLEPPPCSAGTRAQCFQPKFLRRYCATLCTVTKFTRKEKVPTECSFPCQPLCHAEMPSCAARRGT